MPDKFVFDPLKKEVPVAEDLTNAERAMLREMAQPGNPLWKILRKVVDYREGLTQSLLTVDFGSPEAVEAGRKTQAAALAIHWLEETFDANLTDVEGEEQPEQA